MSRNSPRFSSVTRPSRAAAIAAASDDARTGEARNMCSNMAGFGLRSGNVMPSMQNTPSLGSSPKSPP